MTTDKAKAKTRERMTTDEAKAKTRERMTIFFLSFFY